MGYTDLRSGICGGGRRKEVCKTICHKIKASRAHANEDDERASEVIIYLCTFFLSLLRNESVSSLCAMFAKCLTDKKRNIMTFMPSFLREPLKF
jgi:hypothetical protein